MNDLQSIISSMTLEEKVGQLFIVRCPRKDAIKMIEEDHVGGVTLYDVDFDNKTPEEVKADIRGYQKAAKIPLFIAVDEEGGRVCRVSNHKPFRESAFLYPQELVAKGGAEEVRKDAVEKAELLTSLGINVDYAPVCDVSSDPESFIYRRTYGCSPEETAGYIEEVVKAFSSKNLCSTLKHFPGYGDNMDTHIKTSVDNRSLETFITSELIPFTAGINAGADLVMISHNIIECLEPGVPASLSAEVYKLLRDTLGFEGIIVTDSLDMDAVTLYCADESSAVKAIVSGNDLLCCTNYKTQIPAIIKAIKDGIISEERIDSSLVRLLKKKQALGLI